MQTVSKIEHLMTNDPFPLYDVPWLVRDPNDFHMSAERHAIELRNQNVVDDFFIARSHGCNTEQARRLVAVKHNLTIPRVDRIIRWFYEEAKKRRKYEFLQKYMLVMEHITDF